jgi:branched-chain amino acid transport system substrate-binding protein
MPQLGRNPVSLLSRNLSRVFALPALLLAVAVPAAADVKIGFMAPMTGPQSQLGQDQHDGFMLGLKLLGDRLGGQAVTVIKRDDQVNPAIGVQIVDEFVGTEKVDAIVGLSFSNVFMAVHPRLKESGVVAIGTNAGPSPVAGALCAPNVFSIAWQSDGSAETMGRYAQAKGLNNVVLMAPDFQAGKDLVAGFKRFYRGTVISETYTPLTQTDFTREIQALSERKPGALFAFYPGGLGVALVRQLNAANLIGAFPFLSAFTVDGVNLSRVGASAVGAIVGSPYAPSLDTPRNRAFVTAYIAAYGRAPSEYAAAGFDAASALDAAIRAVDGNLTDRAAFARAVKNARFESVRGKFAFNSNNMPVQDFHSFEVVRDGDGGAFRMIETTLPQHVDAYVGSCAMPR